FYQRLAKLDHRSEEEEMLLYMVQKVRNNHPHMSARTMYKMILPETIGRDKFERLCMKNGLRVKKQKNYRVTTNSKGVIRFPNLIQDIEVTGVNQVFVSDITYYEMNGRFEYITLIMDLYNREVVGSSVSQNLRTENTTIPAIRQLIRTRGSQNLENAIFHSDGGGQYYCKEFIKITKKLKMRNSMTQEKVYENAHSERLNGTIKNDYLYPYHPNNRQALKNGLKKAIWMYNNEKPHSSLNDLTPVQYRNKNAVDNENISSRYFPLPTAHHHHDNRKKECNV
ncbi:MAG: IS3 family transposase, partial [Deltaproteobacteria bacterium]|nr:IS3 family transposase [Deltaproteobacteria bacterium]